MIRQITMVKFKPEVSGDDITALGTGFAKISNVVPGIHRFEFGPNLNLMEGTWDYALVIDFEDETAMRAYAGNADHVAFAQTFVPLGEAVARVHYTV